MGAASVGLPQPVQSSWHPWMGCFSDQMEVHADRIISGIFYPNAPYDSSNCLLFHWKCGEGQGSRWESGWQSVLTHV